MEQTTTTNIQWTHIRCVGASGSDQILDMTLIKSTPSLHRPERGAISSWSKFFSHTVLRRNSWPLDLCIETQPADFSTPIHWNGPRRDAIKMDKESSSGQTERAIDSSRHALKGDVFRISRFRHQLVIYGTRLGRSWSKSAKTYVSIMVSDS